MLLAARTRLIEVRERGRRELIVHAGVNFLYCIYGACGAVLCACVRAREGDRREGDKSSGLAAGIAVDDGPPSDLKIYILLFFYTYAVFCPSPSTPDLWGSRRWRE